MKVDALICHGCDGEYGDIRALDSRLIADMACLTCPTCKRDLALVRALDPWLGNANPVEFTVGPARRTA